MRQVLCALVLFAGPAVAAPVPRAERFTEASLVGTWRKEWGSVLAGPVTFERDGTYVFRPETGCRVYVGHWWVEGGALVLVERWVAPELAQVAHEPARFEIRFTATTRPRLVGAVTGSGTQIVLTEPRVET